MGKGEESKLGGGKGKKWRGGERRERKDKRPKISFKSILNSICWKRG